MARPVRKSVPAKGAKPPPCPLEQEKARVAREASRREHIAAVRELAFRDFLADLVRQNARPLPPLPPPVQPRPSSRKPAERHALLPLHDWHFEETVRPESVNGLNDYGIPQACRRVWRVVEAACAWKADREAGGRCRVPLLVVPLLGDMVTGTLHGLERHSRAPNVVRAAIACGDLIALALRRLASVFPRVEVECVSGNHGRLPDDRRVPSKDPTRSWDYLAYSVARRRLEGQKNISWHIPDSYGVLFQVAGWQCYAAHGNFIPQAMGIVGYGIRRFASNLAANLGAAGKPLKYAFFGHFHQSNAAEFAGIEAFIGPSLIGTQEYSYLSGGAVNRAAQELHVFDRELGHVARERLYADGPGFPGTFEIEV